jgi:hypothetical protein
MVDQPPLRSVLGLLPPQENVQPPIAESRTLGRQFPQPSPQHHFVPFLSPVPPAPAVHPDQPTGASLAEPCFFPHDTHRFSFRPRAYHFFANTTFSASRSRACCATIFFSPFHGDSPLAVLYPEKLSFAWTKFRGAGQFCNFDLCILRTVLVSYPEVWRFNRWYNRLAEAHPLEA